MGIQEAVASCQQIIEHASGSIVLRTSLVLIFIVIPLLRVVFSILKTKRQVNKYLKNCSQNLPDKLQKVVKANKLERSLFYVACSERYVAVSIGFIDKKIILSRKLINLLEYAELEAIVLHEYHHARSHHALKILLLELAAKTLFVFPILSDVTHYFKARFETSADAAAVTRQNTTTYIMSSLRKVISYDTHLHIFPQFSHLIIDERIDALNKVKPKRIVNYFNFFISVLSITVLTGIFLFNSTYAVAQTMEEMETKITCSLFDCVQDCVAHEFIQRTPQMSENNFSVER